MNPSTPLEIARAWIDAAARCDLAAIEAGMAEDCLRYGEPDWIVSDKASYVEGYRQFLASFSNYRLEVLNVIAVGRTVVFELIESATFSAPYRLPNGEILAPTGQSYTDRACTWLEVNEDGLIAQIRAYIPSTRGRIMSAAAASA